MAIQRYYVGCPFWGFKDWVGSFYAAGTQPRDYLRQYASVFNTVEGHTTFYSIPSEASVRRWRDQVPEGFRFCFKFPRTISHEKQLNHAADDTADFLARMAPLEGRLGPFLLQLPPSFGPDRLPLLDAYLGHLPTRFEYSVELRHRQLFDDDRLRGHVDQLLDAHGCQRTLMDTRALRSGDENHPAIAAARHKKPDLPVVPIRHGIHPQVRFIAHPDFPTSRPWLETWGRQLAEWIQAGKEPYIFIHTPDNLRTPHLARDFHQALAEHVAISPLPENPCDRKEEPSGQLRLL